MNTRDLLIIISKKALEISKAGSAIEVFSNIDEILKLIKNRPEFNNMYSQLIKLKSKYE